MYNEIFDEYIESIEMAVACLESAIDYLKEETWNDLIRFDIDEIENVIAELNDCKEVPIYG